METAAFSSSIRVFGAVGGPGKTFLGRRLKDARWASSNGLEADLTATLRDMRRRLAEKGLKKGCGG